MDETSPTPIPDAILCPACGEAVPPPDAGAPQLVECPGCGNQFFLETDEDDAVVVLEEEPTSDELDARHIRQIVHLRRSNIRSRTHAIVLTLCCVVAAAELLYMTGQQVRATGWDMRPILYVFTALIATVVATLSSRNAAALHREVKAAPPPPPPEPPQFDELSDGSQHAKNLEEM